eukprot:917066-Pelagomonas_calceolata.AAC.7
MEEGMPLVDFFSYTPIQEYAAMPSAKGEGVELPNVPWGIISVKAQVWGVMTLRQRIQVPQGAADV